MDRKNRAENWSFDIAVRQNFPDWGLWGGRGCSSEGIYCSDEPKLSCIVMPVFGPGHSRNHTPEAGKSWVRGSYRQKQLWSRAPIWFTLSKEQTLAIQIILAFKITWMVTLRKILVINFNQQVLAEYMPDQQKLNVVKGTYGLMM